MGNLIAFYNVMAGRVDKGRAGDISCLDFSEDFDSVSSHNILIGRLRKCGLDERRSQKVTISRVKSSRKPSVSGDPQGSFLDFIQLIKGLDVGIQCTLNKLAYDTKLEELLMHI